jgi:hypothetical protein
MTSDGDWEFDSSCGVRTLKGSALDNPVYTVRRGGTILGAVPGQEPKAITKGGMRATQPPPKVAVDASVAFESWFDLLTGT